MQQWVQNLTTGWPMIRANLPMFFVILAAMFGGVWIVMNWTYGGIISSKNGQIELQDRQLADYKAKVGGATPDEVKAKLDELAEINKHTVGAPWQSITPQEATNLQKAIEGIPPRFINVMYSNFRGKSLASAFAKTLKAAGWTQVNLTEAPGLGYGVWVGYGSGTANSLKEAIENSTNISVELKNPQEKDEKNSGIYIAVGINQN